MSKKAEIKPESGLVPKSGATFEKRINPILDRQTVEEFDVDKLKSATVFIRDQPNDAKELRKLMRKQSAEEAIRGLTKTNELYGFTKGQFSLLDLFRAVLGMTGPVRLSVSTWTASREEIAAMAKLHRQGVILSTRWLFDRTFAQRDPTAAYYIRDEFGADSIRISQNHAKFGIFENDDWRLVVRSSMNLNMNPRFEDFTIATDPQLADFIGSILDEIWVKQKRGMLEESHGAIARHFRDDL